MGGESLANVSGLRGLKGVEGKRYNCVWMR